MAIPRLYDKMNQLDTAIEESKKIVDAHPTDINARTQYADFLVKKKDFDGALVQYAELTKNSDASIKGNGYYLTGSVQESMGKPDDALASYKKCVDETPSYAKALDAIGMIYETKNQKDEFYVYLKSVILPGTDKLPYFYYRKALKDAGKIDEVVKTFEELAQKFPDSNPIASSLAQAYVDTGAKDKAVAHYEKMLAKNEKMAGAQRNLGDLYKEMGRFADAAKCYDAYIKAASPFIITAVQKDLADMYVKSGKIDEALEAYRAYLVSDPNNEQVGGYIKTLEGGNLPTLEPIAPKPVEPKIEPKSVGVVPSTKPVEPAQPEAKSDGQPSASTEPVKQ